VLAVFCVEGRLQAVVDDCEYRLSAGDFFVYTPGRIINEILLSPNAKVRVIAFAQRAIDRSLYLNKYVWQNMAYVKAHPHFTLNERERRGINYYYQLMMMKTQGVEGRPSEPATDSSVRQSGLVYQRFMRLLAVLNNALRDVLLGMIPFFVGDIIDIFHRANTKNMAMIQGFVDGDETIIKEVNQKAWQSAIVLIVLLLLIALMIWALISFGSYLYSLVASVF
jgi:hypothetical protein